MPYLALQGVRVLDVSHDIAGSFCAKMLADYGAEVIKVEQAGVGDPSRTVGPFPHDMPHLEKSALYLHLNTNKKGITLDLRDTAGVAVFKRLVEKSDILIESFSPGTMAGLGIGYEKLKGLRPGLVMTSVTPFGQTGPYKDYQFTELTIFAMTGSMHREGLPDREPLKYGGEITQYFAGTAAATATMTALYGAAMTGVGDWIDISIQECMAGHPHQIGRRAPYVYSGESDGRREPRVTAAGGREPYAVGTFRCKDGGYVSFLPLGPHTWPYLARMIEQPGLVDDERFATDRDRSQRRLELEAIFQQWFDVHTKYEVFEAAQKEGVPCAPVLDVGEVLQNEHFKSREFFVDIVHPNAGELTYTGMPFMLSDMRKEDQGPAPHLGQHNQEIIGGLLGLSDGNQHRLGREKLTQTREAGSGRTNTASRSSKLPLEGVRALELAEIWAGPFCGSLLGDMGAEVIKVESIQRIARGLLNPAPDDGGYPGDGPGDRPWNRFANFNALNRNKQGITLNLTSPKGVEAFFDLVRVSDVVFTNYAYGVMERLGLGYQTLREIKPDLVVLFMPGYGNTGPYRGHRSMGLTIDALTGHTALRGYPELDLSSNSLVHHPDAVGGITAAFAISTALYHRARTGQGQFIDLSQAEAFMPHLGEIFLEFSMKGVARERSGNRHPTMAPHGCYPCVGEDRWVTIAVRDEREWREFCRVIGMPELCDDFRFSSLAARLENQDELDGLISAWTSSRDRYEVAELLQRQSIPAGPVLDCDGDTYDDPGLQARDYFQVVAQPDAGTYPLSGPIWKLGSQVGRRHEPAPTLGQHNTEVLGDLLGKSSDQLKRLRNEKVIGTVPLAGSDMGGVRRVAQTRNSL